jgi:hypothetical protein
VLSRFALELEFMSLLLLRSAHAEAGSLEEARAVADEAAIKFLSDHLPGWSDLFAERVEAATEEEFYRFTGRLLRGFLDAECQFLGVDLPVPCSARQTGPVPLANVPKDPGPLTCPFATECSELSGSV